MKEQLRKQYQAARDAMDPAERMRYDTRIMEELLMMPAFERAEHVFTYLSIGSEVDTRQIIRAAWETGKTIAIPRCVPGTRLMEWHIIRNFDDLHRGAFGIEEPAPDIATRLDPPTKVPSSDVALIPGCAFDINGFRLGYGGGYYDRFLADFSGMSIGLCRRDQLSREPLPQQEHDIPVDKLIVA